MTFASYNSKGPSMMDQIVKPDIVAPGNLIVSQLAQEQRYRTQYPSDLINLSYYMQTSSAAFSTKYFSLSGTSMATAVVSGAAADLLEAEPFLAPDQVKARLMKTPEITYVDQYDILTIGAGYLDLQAALVDTT